VEVIWMLDTDSVIYLVNRGPRHEHIARRMSGRSPGELRLSAVTVSELRFGFCRSKLMAYR
jgi:predicted nucleic acid-binding protein